ncbi:MAG: GerW family sporulation protein [Firmicutes bacterium]|nr:GerW family sporulation protein [Bacillota bacterium]
MKSEVIKEKEVHPIETIMSEAMCKLKGIIDVNTVIGEAITLIDGTTIIPISKVSVGFVAGGGEYGGKQEKDYPFSGGSGAGVNITPIGFLSIVNGDIKIINIENNNTYDKLFDIGGDVLKRFINKKE